MKTPFAILFSSLVSAAAVVAQAPSTNIKVHTVSMFRLPDMDETGRTRGEIFGDAARVPEEGPIDITNMRLFTYDAAGAVQIILTSPHCIYDRKHNLAGSHASVLIQSRDFILSGEGYRCNLRKNRLEIAGKARLVIGSIRNRMKDTEALSP